MDDKLIEKIVNEFGQVIESKPYRNYAVKTLRDVLTSIDNPEDKTITIDANQLDYVKLRDFIDARSIDAVLDRLKHNLDLNNIRTNTELIDFAEARKTRYLNSNGVRDVFNFRATGASGIKALYTYMDKVLKYCPFKNGYTPKELNR